MLCVTVLKFLVTVSLGPCIFILHELFPFLSGHIADSPHILLAVRCGPVTKCNRGNLRATSCLAHRNLQWMIL